MADPKILAEMAAASLEAEKLTGIPAEVPFAQCAIESGWLAHSPGHNCFGIKSYDGAYGRQLLITKEWFTPAELHYFLARGDSRTAVLDEGVVPHNGRSRYSVQDWFATFEDLGQCFAQHSKLFLLNRYKPIVERYHANKNLIALIIGIAKVYATDPNYANLMLSITRDLKVQAALWTARAG